MKKLIVVLPCYNEEEVLPVTINELIPLMNRLIESKVISADSLLYFIDDGSIDNTWDIIKKYSANNKLIKGLKLAKNSGHQNALLAGLLHTKNTADIYISIDCDLQDDIEAIPKMLESYNNGNEIVYGVRSSRKVDTIFKRKSAELFYDVQGAIGVDIIKNHADYRLISNVVLNCLSQYKERNLYLRAMFPIIGFKSGIVYYERKERLAGESKYPLKKMLAFAWDGITSFSTFPLKMITILGALLFIVSMGMAVWIFGIKIFTMQAIPGWASITIPIYFIGGIQLLSIGIIGEYIGKIYTETKQRPRYTIEKSTDND